MREDLEKHYINNHSNFANIILLEKKLSKLSDIDNEESINLKLKELLTNIANQYKLTLEVNDKIKTIIYGEPPQPIEDLYDPNYFEDNLRKKDEKRELIKNDMSNLENSQKEFTSNFQFNALLIYIISFEMIIKLVYDLTIKNLKESSSSPSNKIYIDKLENILFTSICGYIQGISYYKETYLSFKIENIKLDFPLDTLSSI